MSLRILVACSLLQACVHGVAQAPLASASGRKDASSFVAPASNAPCAELEAHWPETISAVEAILRVSNAETFETSVAQMQRYLDAQDTTSCPLWTPRLALQRALIDEFRMIYSMAHAADGNAHAPEAPVAGRTVQALEAEYVAVHDKACLDASFGSGRAWSVWQKDPNSTPLLKRRQRFLVNLETDAALVDGRGFVGAASAADDDFVALVVTPVSHGPHGALHTLQGQGPADVDAATRYVQASVRYAARQGVKSVVFVNMAGGQIDDFAHVVGAHAGGGNVSASYVAYDGWRDGALVTPEQAAHFVQGLLAQYWRDEKAVLFVVNCNAGLDRSGTINALIQLAVQARTNQALGRSKAQILDDGLRAIPVIVGNLKAGRPHSISSFARYLFIYRSFVAYVDSVVAPVHK